MNKKMSVYNSATKMLCDRSLKPSRAPIRTFIRGMESILRSLHNNSNDRIK